MRKARVSIILTACVNPDGMIYTTLQNPEERRRQYIDALVYYLKETNIPIIFVENTLTDFSNLFSEPIRQGRLEYMTFDGNRYDKNLGKGYGEALMLMYAYKHSMIIKHCQYVTKITGRLKVLNIRSIIESKILLINNIFRCELTYKTELNLHSMVFVISPSILYYILTQNYWKMNDNMKIYFEKVLYMAIIQERIITVPFTKPVVIEGVSGTSNKKYQNRRYGENLIINFQAASEWCLVQHRYVLSLIYKCIALYPRLYFNLKKLLGNYK